MLSQVVFLARVLRACLSPETFRRAGRLLIGVAAASLVLGFGYILAAGKTSMGFRIVALVNPVRSKRSNPLATSISEHSSPTWSSIFNDLHTALLFAPLGAWFLLKRPTNRGLFGALLCVVSLYFASVMVRLKMVSAPSVCALAGVGLSCSLGLAAQSLRAALGNAVDWARERRAQCLVRRKPLIPPEFALAIVCLLCWSGARTVFHGSLIAKQGYSSPAFIQSYWVDGQRHFLDDRREAYFWLRQNTAPGARVMAWWDYGYQLAGMANRTTIVDNNTWSKKHIARVGMVGFPQQIFASGEEEAHRIALDLDIDYVLVVFGGYAHYGSDDIAKFLWMVRIAHSNFPHVQEASYTQPSGYQVNHLASRAMADSLLFKLSYYRFCEVDVVGKGAGYDRQRDTHVVGSPHQTRKVDLQHFEEAYTTSNWMVRIYRVKKPTSRASLDYSEAEPLAAEVQRLSGFFAEPLRNPHLSLRYATKHSLE